MLFMVNAKKLFLPLFCIWVFGTTLFGETQAKEFYGYWEIPEANGSTCYVIVKRGGEASCFWAGGKYDTIEKGKWELQGDRLLIVWDGGYKYALEKRGEDSIRRFLFTPSQNPNSVSDDVLSGSRFNRKMVGNMKTEAPDAVEENPDAPVRPWNVKVMKEDREKAYSPFSVDPRTKHYLGYWEVADNESLWGLLGTGNFFLNLDNTGNVTTAQKDWGEDNFGQKGHWTYINDSMQIVWPSGDKAILKGDDIAGYTLTTFEPDDTFPTSPDKRLKVRKRDGREVISYFRSAETILVSMLDYLGHWYVIRDDEIDRSSHIEVERWGICYRVDSPSAAKVKGHWVMKNTEMDLQWDDGKRNALSLTNGDRIFLKTWDKDAPKGAMPIESLPVYKEQPDEKIGEIRNR